MNCSNVNEDLFYIDIKSSCESYVINRNNKNIGSMLFATFSIGRKGFNYCVYFLKEPYEKIILFISSNIEDVLTILNELNNAYFTGERGCLIDQKRFKERI